MARLVEGTPSDVLKTLSSLIREGKGRVAQLYLPAGASLISNSQTNICIYKVQSHAGIAGNECADATFCLSNLRAISRVCKAKAKKEKKNYVGRETLPTSIKEKETLAQKSIEFPPLQLED
eukprot:1156330-Pelagomonas_calceolata.AAC.5